MRIVFPLSRRDQMSARLAEGRHVVAAELAAETVREGEYLFLDSGSTNLAAVPLNSREKSL